MSTIERTSFDFYNKSNSVHRSLMDYDDKKLSGWLSAKKIELSKTDIEQNIARSALSLPPSLTLERHSSAPANINDSEHLNRFFSTDEGNYIELNDDILNQLSYYHGSEKFETGFLYEEDFPVYAESLSSKLSSSSTSMNSIFRGQDGIVELTDNLAIKKLHPKLLRAYPDCCETSVKTWNAMFELIGYKELATATVLNHTTYTMPRISGQTLAEQKKSIDEQKTILREVRANLLASGIFHTDLIHEEGGFCQYNPKNVIFSAEYNTYLPLDVEGVEIMETAAAAQNAELC